MNEYNICFQCGVAVPVEKDLETCPACGYPVSDAPGWAQVIMKLERPSEIVARVLTSYIFAGYGLLVLIIGWAVTTYLFVELDSDSFWAAFPAIIGAKLSTLLWQTSDTKEEG